MINFISNIINRGDDEEEATDAAATPVMDEASVDDDEELQYHSKESNGTAIDVSGSIVINEIGSSSSSSSSSGTSSSSSSSSSGNGGRRSSTSSCGASTGDHGSGPSDVPVMRISERQSKRNREKASSGSSLFASMVPSSLDGTKDFRKRLRNTSFRGSVNREAYNSISEASVMRCHAVIQSVADFDWKMNINRISTEVLEDVALVISPHNHLVDDAWRKLRSYVTEWRLHSARIKLSDVEKANTVPKITRKAAFLVVIANSRSILKKVMAAERVRLGSVEFEADAEGLKFEGIPLTPSPRGVSSSSGGVIGPPPIVTIAQNSPCKFSGSGSPRNFPSSLGNGMHVLNSGSARYVEFMDGCVIEEKEELTSVLLRAVEISTEAPVDST